MNNRKQRIQQCLHPAFIGVLPLLHQFKGRINFLGLENLHQRGRYSKTLSYYQRFIRVFLMSVINVRTGQLLSYWFPLVKMLAFTGLLRLPHFEYSKFHYKLMGVCTLFFFFSYFKQIVGTKLLNNFSALGNLLLHKWTA